MAQKLRVKGYRELLRACDRASRETKRVVRSALRDVGEVVRARAATLFEAASPRSAAGYRVRVRQRGVAVEQSLRRTTGTRPDFGATQMREALIPGLEDTGAEADHRLEQALETMADLFER